MATDLGFGFLADWLDLSDRGCISCFRNSTRACFSIFQPKPYDSENFDEFYVIFHTSGSYFD